LAFLLNHNISNVRSGFRTIPLGDLELLDEIQLNDVSTIVSRQPGRCSVTRLLIAPLRRTYSARVSGRKSDMTVAVYQGQNAEEEWRRDVNKYSGVRHPKFLQVYGVSGSRSLYATVFHDDLIPLQEIYSLCQRSSLATAYLHALFGQELWDAETYIHSIAGTYLHHGSYTPWMRHSTGRLCVDLSPTTADRPIPPLSSLVDAAITGALTLRQHQEIIDHCHSISRWSSESLLVNGPIKLGALVYRRSIAEDPVELASIPTCLFEDSGWELRIRGSLSSSKPVRMKNGWTRFDYFNVMTTGMASREIHWPYAANSWLPQANYILNGLGINSDYDNYRIIYGIDYWLSFSNMADMSPKNGYLFLCPLVHLRSLDGTRLAPPSVAAYWSMDPTGVKRLSHWKATMLGFPALAFKMKIWTRSWDESVYAGLRQFHRGKGFDPDTQDVARHMGVPLYESPWINDKEGDAVEGDIVKHQIEPPTCHSTHNDAVFEPSASGVSVLPKLETCCEPNYELHAPEIIELCVPSIPKRRIPTQTCTLCIWGGLGFFFAVIILWGFSFESSHSTVISFAIQRAERMESWLPDDALINLIDFLKKDVRAAAVYNTIEGEGIRVKWVRRQLGLEGEA
ncbi:hypothetical protein B0H13DRAFT_2029329, partial [Mycena leptocephala]